MVNTGEIQGAGDDRLDAPQVTPAPAPPDDQLVRLAALSAIAGAVITLIVTRWLRRNVTIARRLG